METAPSLLSSSGCPGSGRLAISASPLSKTVIAVAEAAAMTPSGPLASAATGESTFARKRTRESSNARRKTASVRSDGSSSAASNASRRLRSGSTVSCESADAASSRASAERA